MLTVLVVIMVSSKYHSHSTRFFQHLHRDWHSAKKVSHPKDIWKVGMRIYFAQKGTNTVDG